MIVFVVVMQRQLNAYENAIKETVYHNDTCKAEHTASYEYDVCNVKYTTSLEISQSDFFLTFKSKKWHEVSVSRVHMRCRIDGHVELRLQSRYTRKRVNACKLHRVQAFRRPCT